MNEAQILRRFSDLCRLRHPALATERSHVGWTRSSIKALRKMPRPWTSERKFEAFLTGLAWRDVDVLCHTHLKTR